MAKSTKSSVLVLGAGKVGKSVAELLLAVGKGAYKVTIADRDAKTVESVRGNLERLREHVSHKIDFDAIKLDVSKRKAVREALEGHDYVVCMLPFNFVEGIAEAANDAGVHYFDVTEDVETTDKVRRIDAEGRAKVALVPQCGLAPGYIAIAAYDIARRFEEIHSLTLRVGALPQFPTNQLKYNVTWSTAGVVNEYCEPCNVMLGGEMIKAPALDGLENFSFEGVEYEAFYTSGGVGSLIDTLIAEKRTSAQSNIAYKTIRYPGHCHAMRFLLQDLRLGAESPDLVPEKELPNRWTHPTFNRSMLVNLFDHAIPRTKQDTAVIFINAVGKLSKKDNHPTQINFQRAIPATDLWGRTWPAIELTTCAGVCTLVDMHRLGALPRATGLIRQEECSLEQFNANAFGRAYEDPASLAG